MHLLILSTFWVIVHAHQPGSANEGALQRPKRAYHGTVHALA
jgi:hypothetical protein